MGKKKGGKKGGRPKSGGPRALDVFDEDERLGTVGGDLVYDNGADAAELAEDEELSKALDKAVATKAKRRVHHGERFDDVYGVSDPDDDDDADVPAVRQDDSDLEDDDNQGNEHDGLGNWGTKKKYFYGGNPNDPKGKDDNLQDGDMDEAEAEAEESKAIQLKQLQELDEEDFFDSFGGSLEQTVEDKLSSAADGEGIELDLSKLNKKEKVLLFHRESPEFKSIMADFKEKVEEASSRLQPVLDLINNSALPGNNQAAIYVRTKHQLILNYCANVSAFLMFKTQRANLKFHPITTRLVQYKQLLDKMSPLDEAMRPEIDKVLGVVSKHQSEAKKVAKTLKKMTLKHNSVKDGSDEKPKNESKPNKKRKRLQILSNEDKGDEQAALTLDEEKALELYAALKSKKAKMDQKEEASSSDESAVEDVEKAAPEEELAPLDGEEDGDERRGITYQIAKNKGLQPKRSKLQRNPRVKHRHKFEKAKIRRKGQVREVRKEVKKYSGELTGINARVKKGVKLM